jgi:hypothetical protein
MPVGTSVWRVSVSSVLLGKQPIPSRLSNFERYWAGLAFWNIVELSTLYSNIGIHFWHSSLASEPFALRSFLIVFPCPPSSLLCRSLKETQKRWYSCKNELFCCFYKNTYFGGLMLNWVYSVNPVATSLIWTNLGWGRQWDTLDTYYPPVLLNFCHT